MNPPAAIKDLAWSIIDDLPLSFYVKDTHSRFIYVNKRTAAALRLSSPEAALGLTDHNIFDVSVANQWHEAERRLIEDGVPVKDTIERELLKGISSPVQRVLTSKERLFNTKGEVIGLVGMSKSLSGHLEEFDHIMQAVDGAQDGLWYSDLRTCSVWFSARWKQMLGFEDHELPNNPREFRSRVHEKDWYHIKQTRDEHFAGKSSHYECKFRMRHKTDRWLWILSRGKARFADDGTAVEFAGSHTDITQITTQTELYEAIIKALPALVFVKDSHLRFRYVNPELLNYFNMQLHDVIGRTDLEVNPDKKQAERFLADDQQILSGLTEKLIPEERLTDQRTGKVRFLQTRKQLFPFPSNNPEAHVLGVATDISGIVEAREQIRALQETVSTTLSILKTMVIDIEKAPTERDACMVAKDKLAEFGPVLGFSSLMISFERTQNGQPFIIADPEFATGKWQSVASGTTRPCKPKPGDRLDILPYVLYTTEESEFVADSQTHGLCDNDLSRKHDIVSQYVIPLQTPSLKIGTLQIEMGVLDLKPEDKCGLYDAIAAHLSVAIERHRRLVELEEVNSRLLSTAKLFAFSAAGAAVMHDLKHSLSTYTHLLNRTATNNAVRSCVPARDFLKDTRRFVETWGKSLDNNLNPARSDGPGEAPLIGDVVREVVEVCQKKAVLRNSTIYWKDFVEPGLRVSGTFWQIREMLSVLVFNAIDAHARTIRIEAQSVETLLPKKGIVRRYGRVRVYDDGVGIATAYQAQIGKFRWTSRESSGHGIGLTIVAALAEALEGELALRSGGKSVGDNETVFELHLPLTP